MAVDNFDPSGVGATDAGIFGLPHSEKEAEVVLIPVPWDVTTSYKPGTHQGPEAILQASPQLDLYHPDFPDLWKKGVFLQEIPGWVAEQNAAMREEAEKVIAALESGKKADKKVLKTVNDASASVTEWLKKESLKQLKHGKTVGVVGGDHSVPLGLMQAIAEHHGDFGILHFDAHHDYREAYMGFAESHASIMYNAAKIPQMKKLIQVGIRDYCREEMEFAKNDRARFTTYYDQQLKEAQFDGTTWHEQCIDIVRHLPEKIYISFDIDGLSPHLCPSTGTPVPGGLSFEQAVFLIKLASRARKVVGFDLVEVGGDADSIDANVGARLLWHLCGYTSTSHQSQWTIAG